MAQLARVASLAQSNKISISYFIYWSHRGGTPSFLATFELNPLSLLGLW